jgi:hypothetical protein
MMPAPSGTSNSCSCLFRNLYNNNLTIHRNI